MIAPVAERLNRMSQGRPFGRLQEIRRDIKKRSLIASKYPFDERSTKDDYAFHYGGRPELQFNIGLEDRDLRHGLAFSFEPSRSLPDPVELLLTSVARLNDFMRQDHDRYSRFWRWHHEGTNPRIRSAPVRDLTVPPALVRKGNFVFFGATQPLRCLSPNEIDYDQIDYQRILVDFDDLLDIYVYVESAGHPYDTAFARPRFEFHSSRVPLAVAATASRPEATLDISYRHNRLQTALRNELAAEFGEDRVQIECPVLGNRIDLAVRFADRYDIYEIKTAHSPRVCIREALGQVLEYACWPDPIPFRDLVVVGETPIDEAAANYLAQLRYRFNIPLTYRRVALRS